MVAQAIPTPTIATPPTESENDEACNMNIHPPVAPAVSQSPTPPTPRNNVEKHVVRLKAFLHATIAEAEHRDVPITAQSIRLEALLLGAATELDVLKSAMESRAATTAKHVARLEAFLAGAVADVDHNDAPITPQSIRLEALLHGAAAKLSVLKVAMST